jgi:hypothetical protein
MRIHSLIKSFFLCLALLQGCNEEKLGLPCEDYGKKFETYTKASGIIIRYDEKWAIMRVADELADATQIDGGLILFCCNLPSEFQVEELPIVWNGTAFHTTYSPLVQVAGIKFGVALLDQIEKRDNAR